MDISKEQLLSFPKCKAIADLKGWESKYVKDCAIRELIDKRLTDLFFNVDVDWTAEVIVIRGGIGTLVMRESGNEFTPAPTLAKMAIGLSMAVTQNVASLVRGENIKASDATVEKRMKICCECPLWNPEKEICGACGCGSIKQKLANSVCPKEKWGVEEPENGMEA